jgi:cation diffusion facilitator CzcD-associated flavoprotein CzcO
VTTLPISRLGSGTGPDRLDVQAAHYLPDDPADPSWPPLVEIAVHQGDRYRLIGLTPGEARCFAAELASAASKIDDDVTVDSNTESGQRGSCPSKEQSVDSESALPDLLGALDFDPEELRAKYRYERDRRLRPDASAQYTEAGGELSHFVDDPYTEPGFSRPPVQDHVQVTIIGGGFAGLCSAARLRETGIETVRNIDTAGDFGGTWYWNRYPGAACDVESYIYLPMLEELRYMPTRKYVYAPEILEHARRIARHYDLYRNALLQTSVTELRWDARDDRWIVSTNRGDKFTSQFVVMANGPLSTPKLPGIPGIATFKGHMFHTSRWDYGYTGGSPDGGLRGLAGKRVGIIGTGATAIQCIPHLGQAAEHLYVFQRTPSSVDARANQPTDPDWFKSLPPGWQSERMANFTVLINGGSQDTDLVHDGWTDMARIFAEISRHAAGRELTSADRSVLYELADFKKMEQIRHRIGAIVSDQATAEALKPYYRFFCKRPCFNDDYLETFNRLNVTLVDTQGRGVDQLTERAAVVAGADYELDCLIFATGFDVSSGYTRRAGYEVYGRESARLSEKWADGVKSLHGMQTHGFPNLFLMSTSQTGVTLNFTHSMSELSRHIAYIVRQVAERGGQTAEVTLDAERAWCEEVRRTNRIGAKFYAECTPGYYNSEGQPGNPVGLFSNTYGLGATAFFQILADWRAAGAMAGVTVGGIA